MPWPAIFNPPDLHRVNLGTVYTSTTNFPAIIRRHEYSGQAWRFRNRYSTYCPSRKLTYKSLESLKPNSEVDFVDIMDSCRVAGMMPPTSFVDCYRHVSYIPIPLTSVIAPFRHFVFGGWQQLFFWPRDAEAWHYDINRAYRWAACQGLPDTRWAYGITSHFRFATEPCAVYLMEVAENAIPYDRKAGIKLVTSEEWEALCFCPVRIIEAIAFAKQIDLTESFQKIDALFPTLSPRIGRAFWSIWNSRIGPEVCSWKTGGRVRQMRNIFYNPIWAAYITSRVSLRLAQYRNSLLKVHTDSMFITKEIETGTAPGEFRLISHFTKREDIIHAINRIENRRQIAAIPKDTRKTAFVP